MERNLNGFIQKEKDKVKMRKMCATQKGRHAGIFKYIRQGKVDSDMDDK